MRVLTVAATFAIALASPEASPAKLDGSTLLRSCTTAVAQDGKANVQLSSDESFGFGLCLGLLRGIVEMSGAMNLVCTPDEFDYTQMARIVVKRLEDHPETLHSSASALAYTAIQEAFPCGTKSKGAR